MSPSRPIVVLADDLSGAAELAGVAAARGLTAVVQRHADCGVAAPVTAIDTDSRGLPAEVAALRMRDVARQVTQGEGVRIFKKVDSLLRGQPRVEIEVLMQAGNWARAALIPANPSRGRTISGGQYLVNGVRLQETMFAKDPEFPRASADVTALIGTRVLPVHNVRAPAKLPLSGVVVPDAESVEDIQYWAEMIDSSVLAAGAADFFAAMLNCWCRPITVSGISASPGIELPGLLVCGSYTAWQSRKNECVSAGLPVLEVGAGDERRVDELAGAFHAFQARRGLVLSSGEAVISQAERAESLQELARVAAAIVREGKPKTLLLEGGATAAAVVSQLGWNRFAVVPSNLPAGVGVLKPMGEEAAPVVLIKPGSYAWPTAIWDSFRG